MSTDIDRVRWADVDPPTVEVPPRQPELSAAVYERRLERLRERMGERALDAVVIYADREHDANFSYLTGFGPRFEEALLVVGRHGTPTVLLGHENIGMAGFTPVDLRPVRFPAFSLLGQPRPNVGKLESVLNSAGIERGAHVGTIGWKYYGPEDGVPTDALEVPHFVVEAVASASGTHVQNVTDLMMSSDGGLRTVLDIEEIVLYEYAAAVAANAVLAVMDGAAPGKSEVELSAPLNDRGRPLSVHPMLSVGEKARHGLTSPTDRTAERGDFLTTAFGVPGAMSCRAAFLADGPADLAPEVADWLARVAFPFYAFAVDWLQTVGIGLEGGVIWDLAEERLPRSQWGWELNPGHFIHHDEWVSTPFTPGSTTRLRSGNYIQLDLIICPKPPYFGANLEDGVVLADENTRSQLRDRHPDVWSRFERRRRYLAEQLGIKLGEDVLPMSDLLGYYRPFLLEPGKALRVA